MWQLDGMPKPPESPDVLRIKDRRLEWTGGTLRIGGWLAPTALHSDADGTIQWFHNGVHISNERPSPSLPQVYGAIGLSDGQAIFRRSSVTTLFEHTAHPESPVPFSAVEKWLGGWLLKELRDASDPGIFLRGCLNGPGLAGLVRSDREWAELVYRYCPFPTTANDETMEKFVENHAKPSLAPGHAKEIRDTFSIWNRDFRRDEKSLYIREPGPREVAHALAERRDIKILYIDERHVYGDRDEPQQGEHQHLEGIFSTAFGECGWPFVKVRIRSTLGFSEDARLYRSPSFDSNWHEHAVLELRADSRICQALCKMPSKAILQSEAALSVYLAALQWCTGDLGDIHGQVRKRFWPHQHVLFEYLAGTGRGNAKNEIVRLVEEIAIGKPSRRV